MMASCSSSAKEAEGESTNGPNWLELPSDVTTNILQKLGTVEIVTSASQVCSLWWNICKIPLMWRAIVMTKHPDYPNSKLVEICRCSVQRSCGHLEVISIEDFATDDLIKYIADRASHLRWLSLPRCGDISDEGMCEVAKKLPLLEFLDISYTELSAHSLEAIGSYCPLKALKFNKQPAILPLIEVFANDEEAFAIAKTMPELRHLHIAGNYLSNDGLLAILNGCPLLKSLDLRACLTVSLSGSLGKRCHDQIKEIRLPNDFEFKIPDCCPSDIHPDFNSEEFMMEFLQYISGEEYSQFVKSIACTDYSSEDDFSI